MELKNFNLNDIVCIFSLILLIPVLVKHYLASPVFSRKYRSITVWGGILWMAMGLYLTSMVMWLLGVDEGDAGGHHEFAQELVFYIGQGDWDSIREYGLTSNNGFRVYIAILYYVTGVGKASAETINSFFGFWGALILTRYFGGVLTDGMKAPKSMLFITFLPSAIFWTSMLMKESIMFWSICLFYTSFVPTKLKQKFRFKPLGVLGFIVGCVLRPYTMVAWVVAVTAVVLYSGGNIKLSILMVLGFFLSLSLFTEQLGVDSIEDAKTYGQYMVGVTTVQAGETGHGSAITGQKMFFVTGAVSLFFRPFLWNVRAFRLFISSMEIWIITALIAYGWLFYAGRNRWQLLFRSDVLVSVLVCMAFCVMFSYMANEGQVSRSRLQAMPALVTLAYIPYAFTLSKRLHVKRMRTNRSAKLILQPFNT